MMSIRETTYPKSWLAQTRQIKSVGFDLDGTLYPRIPAMDRIIQNLIIGEIAQRLYLDLNTAREKFNAGYALTQSASTTLTILGLLNAREIVNQALASAPIEEYIAPNPNIARLIHGLRDHHYHVGLITSSPPDNAGRKLARLGNLRLDTFDTAITGNQAPKSTGAAYQLYLSTTDASPKQCLYIGDRYDTDVVIPTQHNIVGVLLDPHHRRTDCITITTLNEIPALLGINNFS